MTDDIVKATLDAVNRILMTGESTPEEEALVEGNSRHVSQAFVIEVARIIRANRAHRKALGT